MHKSHEASALPLRYNRYHMMHLYIIKTSNWVDIRRKKPSTKIDSTTLGAIEQSVEHPSKGPASSVQLY